MNDRCEEVRIKARVAVGHFPQVVDHMEHEGILAVGLVFVDLCEYETDTFNKKVRPV